MLTVAGVGSRVRGDDSIGLRLVESLPDSDHVATVLWEDADALAVAHELLSLDGPALIVDCADMGLAAGEFRVFDAEGARLVTRADTVSTHGFGLADALALARELGFTQPVTFFGVQPQRLDLAGELSAPLAGRFDLLCAALAQTVTELHRGRP
jgi:hydrogenase maturation protease